MKTLIAPVRNIYKYCVAHKRRKETREAGEKAR